MPLPTPNEISWSQWSKNFKIDTPTFRLTPVEKPDMSPFLIHMTGKRAIYSILKGEGTPDGIEVPQGWGYIQANTPEYNQQGIFDGKVVCFSESPTFALDFFRYRSIERWKADQRFGIGFDKSALVKVGIRPVVYVEEKINKNLIYLFHKITDDHIALSEKPDINIRLKEVIAGIYPLLYPLMETFQSQGFMWEREWRYTDPAGLVFNHNDIKIICCPDDEEKGIRAILAEASGGITFVRTWQEYDDIKDYLQRQQLEWGLQREQYEQAEKAQKLEDTALHIQALIQQYTLALNSLEAYENLITRFSKEAEKATQERMGLSKQLETLRKRFEEVDTELQKTQGKAAQPQNEG
jgi:hypothetical protein